MSHTRHGRTALTAALAMCALLSACSGSGDSASSTAPPTQETSSPSQPTDSPSTSSPTSPSTPAPVVALTFSPRSGGKHLDDCQRLVPGDDPAEFLYYPVLVKTSLPVTLDGVAPDGAEGGVVAVAAWVAPAGPTPETGTFKGWPPPKIVTGDSNLQWSKRVPAAGATLDPATGFYNVFLRLQVDPTPGDSEVKGITFSFHNAGGDHTITWVAHTTFSMSC